MHHRVDSDDSGDGKQLDPVTIAAKSVTTLFGVIIIARFCDAVLCHACLPHVAVMATVI